MLSFTLPSCASFKETLNELQVERVSEDGNVSISLLMITPTREDHGKALSCRATNELVRNGVRETAMKLNVFCKRCTSKEKNYSPDFTLLWGGYEKENKITAITLNLFCAPYT
uniref:Ig-like domain-containing protein n=1 Tax=Glossina pallidipes TaxID=7398 RepID=A0A1B0AIM3_GLOPL